MVWKILQWFGRFARRRQVGIIATSTTLAVGLVLYEKLKEKVAHADSRYTSNSSHAIFSYAPFKERGSGDSVNNTSKSITSGVKWDDNWDRRDPVSLVDAPETAEARKVYSEMVNQRTPSAARHLILVRHGEYVHMDTNDSQCVLTSLGREQAALTGQRLHDLRLGYSRIVSSTMARAVETANIIHKYLPEVSLDHDDLLCEGRPIVPAPVVKWRPEHYYFQDGARIEAAFRKYFHRADPTQKADSVEVIVCHANVIRYFVCRALQFPPEAWLRMSVPHASLTQVTIQPSGHVHLLGLGNTGHMAPSKVTTSSRGNELL